MRRAAGIAALLALHACSGAPPEAEVNAAEPRSTTPPAAPAPPSRPEAQPTAPAAEGESAADVLKLYYGHIAARRFEEAWRLREPSARGPTAARFAANYADHREITANVGPPSGPGSADGWLYVEVPVQTYGTTGGGRPFSSAGTVTLRRREAGGDWRIYGG